ncbi:hypothetical protein SAMN06265348_11433 [Pedobacter westerhofensis]|uniref:YXWGXW repeat-containing protein n=1 Tax=Pedobacter westerhofensis TaxID=425512 RepID=A0A521FMF5_9SPHI|nr:hypothetical protein [Pedobacter westerhofensis]SMO97304.1 hypothetical protein SAMN06265348_11433 [Pedobacter westerhofensis]
MKNLKLIILVVAAVFTFGTADAQSVVLRVGNNGPHHPPRERVVVHHRRPAPHGRYYHNGRHYAHRTVYYKNKQRHYRYN